jgi:hypothetical protein
MQREKENFLWALNYRGIQHVLYKEAGVRIVMYGYRTEDRCIVQALLTSRYLQNALL